MRTRVGPLAACAVIAAIAGCDGDTPVAQLEVTPTSLRLGYPETEILHLRWEILAALEEKPLVFVHLYDHPLSVARTFDHPFPADWRLGDTVEYDFPIFQSVLGPDLEPGPFRIAVGLYHHGAGRLPVETTGHELLSRSYTVVDVEIEAPSAAPSFVFSDEWDEIEPALGKQHVGRRWLFGGVGSIAVEGLPAAADVWLSLWMPPAIGEATNEFTTRVETDCGPSATTLSGSRRQQVALRLSSPSDDPSEPCTIHFAQTPRDPGIRLSVEALSWTPIDL